MLRSKIVVVILGALLVGGVGSALGVLSAVQPHATALGSVAASTATGASGTGTPTSTPSASDTPALPPSPNPTPTRVPPTPTPLPVPGQTLDLHGSVGNINQGQSTFVLNVPGGSYTVTVTSSTQWPGQASSIQQLQTGWQAEVQGVYTGGGNLTASVVDAQRDN